MCETRDKLERENWNAEAPARHRLLNLVTDSLIGINQAELHFSITDIRG